MNVWQIADEWNSVCISLSDIAKSNGPGEHKNDIQMFTTELYRDTHIRDTIAKWIKNLPVIDLNTKANKWKAFIASTASITIDEEPSPMTIRSDRIHLGNELMSPARGRYVVAAQDLIINDAIICERAFSFVPLSDAASGQEWPNICSHCAGIILIARHICTDCYSVVYCNRSCQSADQRLHRFECPGFRRSIWQALGIAHLAFRTMLRLVFGRNEDGDDNNTDDETKRLEVDAVTRLGTNFTKLKDTNLLHSYAMTACMLTIYCRDYTTLFKVPTFVDAMNVEKNPLAAQLRLASSLLLHMGQVMNNAHTLIGIKFASNESALSFRQSGGRGRLHDLFEIVATGSALFPQISILNHSCEPNIRNHFNGDMLTVHATQSIGMGAEVFNCYGISGKLVSRSERQELLMDQYGFQCECTRCMAADGDALFHERQSYRCGGCGQMIRLKCDDWNWWQAKESIRIVCPKCKLSLNVNWWTKFLDLLEQPERTLTKAAAEACELYEQADVVLSERHGQRLTMAQLLLGRFVHLAAVDRKLYEAFKRISIDLLRARELTFGKFSLEYCEAAAYLLDLYADKRLADGRLNESDMQFIEDLRIIFENVLPHNVYRFYIEYINCHLINDAN